MKCEICGGEHEYGPGRNVYVECRNSLAAQIEAVRPVVEASVECLHAKTKTAYDKAFDRLVLTTALYDEGDVKLPPKKQAST